MAFKLLCLKNAIFNIDTIHRIQDVEDGILVVQKDDDGVFSEFFIQTDQRVADVMRTLQRQRREDANGW